MSNETAIAENTLAALAADINGEHHAVEQSFQVGLAHAIRCGELLTEAKALVPHGTWLPWLTENCVFSERTAQAYIQVFIRRTELSANTQRVAHLSFREAVKLLSEPQQLEPELELGVAILVNRLCELYEERLEILKTAENCDPQKAGDGDLACKILDRAFRRESQEKDLRHRIDEAMAGALADVNSATALVRAAERLEHAAWAVHITLLAGLGKWADAYWGIGKWGNRQWAKQSRLRKAGQ